jgi:hypothetical protein
MEKLNIFFGVVGKPETYLSIFYHILAFPLGIFYFVFLLAGLCLGLGLIIIWIGIPILLLVLFIGCALGRFERQLAILLLRVKIPPMTKKEPDKKNFWERFKNHLSNPVTWKSLAFLFIKFPVGIISFVVTITLLSVSIAFISAPVTYNYIEINTWLFTIDSLALAIIISFLGIIIGFLSLHVFYFMGEILGKFAVVMLGYNGYEKE